MTKLTVKVDSQILTAMNSCPELYRLSHIEHWRPLTKAAPLEKGTMMHHMLKVYREGKRDGKVGPGEHNLLVEKCIFIGQANAANTDSMTAEDIEHEIVTFKEYVLKWQYDGWEILDVEQPFAKLLYENSSVCEYLDKVYSGLRIIYEGRIDARVRDPKLGVVVVDSKTESRRSFPYILNNQFQGYEWAFGCPVIIDKIGFQVTLEATDPKPDEKGRDKSKFRRLLHDSGGAAIAEWQRDTIEQVKQAIEWHRQLDSKQRTSLMKNRTSCDKFSGCDFQMVCQVPEESRDFKLIAYFYKDRPWDPAAEADDVALDEVADDIIEQEIQK